MNSHISQQTFLPDPPKFRKKKQNISTFELEKINLTQKIDKKKLNNFLIIGNNGVGKTFLIKNLISKLSSKIKNVVLFCLNNNSNEYEELFPDTIKNAVNKCNFRCFELILKMQSNNNFR